MPLDRKYGKVTLEHKPDSMEDDEPVVVFRAQDKLLVPLLARYENLNTAAKPDGFDPDQDEFTQQARDTVVAIAKWQAKHADKVKLPD